MKENPDFDVINLQTQIFGNNICHRSRKIIQKHFPNFKLSKTVRLEFMKNICGEVLISEKL